MKTWLKAIAPVIVAGASIVAVTGAASASHPAVETTGFCSGGYTVHVDNTGMVNIDGNPIYTSPIGAKASKLADIEVFNPGPGAQSSNATTRNIPGQSWGISKTKLVLTGFANIVNNFTVGGDPGTPHNDGAVNQTGTATDAGSNVVSSYIVCLVQN